MDLSKLLKNKAFLNLILSLVFLTAGLLLATFLYIKPNPEKQKLDFQTAYTKRYEATKKCLQDVFNASLSQNGSNPGIQTYLKKFTPPPNITILHYNKDSLHYWSDNSLPFPTKLQPQDFNAPLVHIATAWYGIVRESRKEDCLIGLFLIRHEYPFENNYLHNSFSPEFPLPDNSSLSATKGSVRVNAKDGTFLCYLSEGDDVTFSTGLTLCFLFIWLAAFCTFLLSVFQWLKLLKVFCNRPISLFFTFFAISFLLRTLLFYLETPWTLYSTLLFSPLYYASSVFIPSLGDLFVNVWLLFFVSAVFFRFISSRIIKPYGNSLPNYFVSLVLILLVCGMFELSVFIYKGLLLNSDIPLNLNNIFTLNYLTLLTYSITALLFFTFFMLTYRIFQVVVLFCHNRKTCAWFVSGTVLAYGAVSLFVFQSDVIPFLIFLLLAGTLFATTVSGFRIYSFVPLLLLLILFSSLSTYILLKYQDISEKNQRKLLAQKLISDRDPLAEYSTSEVYSRMQKDVKLNTLLAKTMDNDSAESEAINYILKHSLGNVWSKYNIGITICSQEKMLNVVIPNNAIVNCNRYFDQIIQSVGEPTISGKLFYLDYGTGSASYLAVLPFTVKTDSLPSTVVVYIDITSKTVPKGLGYPELLVDNAMALGPDAGNYSYAFYTNNALSRNIGKYNYSFSLSPSLAAVNGFTSFDKNGYNHLLYSDTGNKTLIISLKKLNLYQVVSPFSYLFVFYFLMFSFFVVLIRKTAVFRLQQVNFRLRLQYAMIAIILTSFVAVGFISWIYISRQNDVKNNEAISEKAHSILIEVQQKLADVSRLNAETGNDIYLLLNKLSLVFFADINFYNTEGELIASSRPQIFEQGLLSTRINPEAFFELRGENRTSYIHKEKIGSYAFLSAYLPCRNRQDQLIGYLNLPYFARQAEIRNEFSNFLVAFITIYILLFIISIIATILIAKYMTAQLGMIREKISGLKLGKPNEKIQWNRKDEIGSLVEAYNMMIDKLMLSAEQLAQSERESAWREMAKQVAHEIKNPLTPMKLSIQHLKRAWDEEAPDFEGRLSRFTDTLVEQIDTLSDIASEFSDFAKMPEGHTEYLNLADVIRSAAALYQNNQQFDLVTVLAAGEDCFVRADRKQLMRVLINLIKNSIQAFVPERRGSLKIMLTKEEQRFLIKVSDNGHGIAGHQAERIFTPNFTTRSGGMGLGLAMVKTIIGQFGGSVTFDSIEGEGTNFIISLPVAVR